MLREPTSQSLQASGRTLNVKVSDGAIRKKGHVSVPYLERLPEIISGH